MSYFVPPLRMITDFTTDPPTLAPLPTGDERWTCEECGRRMKPRRVTVPCCGNEYDCCDSLEHFYCIECDPPEPDIPPTIMDSANGSDDGQVVTT